jgi:hypothetical protein
MLAGWGVIYERSMRKKSKASLRLAYSMVREEKAGKQEL